MLQLVTDQVRGISRKMGLEQVEHEQGLSSFFENFEKNLIGQNLSKNEEKPCSTYLKPISPRHLQNPRFEYVYDTWICHYYNHYFVF